MKWQELPPINIAGYKARRLQAFVHDGTLQVFVGKEPVGPKGRMEWHLSISHTGMVGFSSRIPAWHEIKEARYQFTPNGVYMAMILPPKEEYVNVHETTMHLHEIPA